MSIVSIDGELYLLNQDIKHKTLKNLCKSLPFQKSKKKLMC